MEVAWTAQSDRPRGYNPGEEFLVGNATHVVLVRSFHESGEGHGARSTFRSFRLADGAAGWEASVDLFVSEQPLWLSDGIVVVGWRRPAPGAHESTLMLLDAESGTVRAETTLGPGTPRGLASDGEHVYAAFGELPAPGGRDEPDWVARFDGPSLRHVWSHETLGTFALQAADGLLVERRADALLAYSDGGLLRWLRPGSSFSQNEPAVADGVLVVTHGRASSVAAHDLATGTVLWSRSLDAARVTPPVIDGDEVVLALEQYADGGARSTSLLTLDLATGRETWTVDVDGGYLAQTGYDHRPGLIVHGDYAWIPVHVDVDPDEPGASRLLGVRLGAPDATPFLLDFPQYAGLTSTGLAADGRLVFLGANFRPDYSADLELVAFDAGGGAPAVPSAEIRFRFDVGEHGTVVPDVLVMDAHVTSTRDIAFLEWEVVTDQGRYPNEGQSITWYPADDGPVLVRLNVTDEDGRTTSVTREFVVVGPPERGMPAPWVLPVAALFLATRLMRRR